MREWRTGLLELIGDGPIVGATTLVAWSHQGRVPSEAALAMPAGVVPIPASPGMTTRHRLNRRGDRRLDCALHSIAIQRQRHDRRPRPTSNDAVPKAQPTAGSAGLIGCFPTRALHRQRALPHPRVRTRLP